jgi:hypothetical protein
MCHLAPLITANRHHRVILPAVLCLYDALHGAECNTYPWSPFLNVHWVNAVPDADAFVELTFAEERLRFTRLGFHDHNWGLTPFTDDVPPYVLGPHPPWTLLGRLLAEHEATPRQRLHHLRLRGRRPRRRARARQLRARRAGNQTLGANSAFPPTQATGMPEGIAMDIDPGADAGGIFRVNSTREVVVRGTPGIIA